MRRMITLAGALAGAALLSQYPAFSQQYLQRLAGQVDALTVVAKDFDASALAAGLGREAALEQMTGTEFLTARQEDMRRTFARHAVLSGHLDALRAASPVGRMLMPQRLADPDTLAATWADFEPALPFSVAGAAASGAGLVLGGGFVAGLLGLLMWPLRRLPARRTAAAAPPRAIRKEPPLSPAGPVAQTRPRLAGVRR